MAAHRTTARAKISIPMYLACVLLCLTLISIRLSSGVVARYSTATDSGDGARVIYFGDLNLDVERGNSYIAPGVSLDLNARVTFGGSESATYVFVEVEGVASANATTVTLFAGGPSWSVDTAKWTYLGEYSGTHVYWLELAPNVTLDAYLFDSSTSSAVPVGMTAEQIAALGNIYPQFYASVVQSNGFASPEKAWESLETNHSRNP